MHRGTIGTLPKAMRAVTCSARTYRRGLESAVLEAEGEIDVQTAHHIDTAAACEQSVGIARWLLRHRLEKMQPADILAAAKEIRSAKAQRDKSVRSLPLSSRTINAIDALYALPSPSDIADMERSASDATAEPSSEDRAAEGPSENESNTQSEITSEG